MNYLEIMEKISGGKKQSSENKIKRVIKIRGAWSENGSLLYTLSSKGSSPAIHD
jgi:hypothetical protein